MTMRELWFGIVCVSVYIQNMCPEVVVLGTISFISFNYLTPLCFAKLLQSCPTLCDPIDSSPPGSPVPGLVQARPLEWVAISFSNT